MVHAGGAIVSAIPRWQRLAVGVDLEPRSRRCCKLRAEIRGPVLVESFETNNRRGAQVAQDHRNAEILRLLGVAARGVQALLPFLLRRQAAVAVAADAAGIQDRRAARRGGLSLKAKLAQMVEGMASLAQAQGLRRRRNSCNGNAVGLREEATRAEARREAKKVAPGKLGHGCPSPSG